MSIEVILTAFFQDRELRQALALSLGKSTSIKTNSEAKVLSLQRQNAGTRSSPQVTKKELKKKAKVGMGVSQKKKQVVV